MRSARLKAPKHQVDHHRPDRRLLALRQLLVVFAQPTVATKPGKRPLHDPTMRDDLEALRLRPPRHHLHHPAEPSLYGLHKAASVAAVYPDPRQAREPPLHSRQHHPRAVAVLNVRRMHSNGEQPPEGIYGDMPLATLDLLARIVAAFPPFSVVLTDWLSIMAALGLVSRPTRAR